MGNRIKSDKIQMHRIQGKIIEATKRELKFKINTSKKEYQDIESVPRIQKVENKRDNFYEEPYFHNLPVFLFYLNTESLKGLYESPEMNLPYEIRASGDILVYRQSIVDRKEGIFNKLEDIAKKEGLKNN